MDQTPAELERLATEQRNPAASRLDEMNSLDIVRLMNAEDARVIAAVEQALPEVAVLVDRIADRLQNGGRLLYVGAGTSGRLGTLDAVECPPTFGVEPEMVQCLMAGGQGAWLKAVEGAEDDEAGGTAAVEGARVTAEDIVVGIAASGRTPFVRGALVEARQRGAFTAAITNHPGSVLGEIADLAIEVPVGPEVLTGSTRLKAGTAQKMVLNMLSTASMIRLGKAYGNLMVDVRATNEKLKDRARRIVMEAAGVDGRTAAAVLAEAGGSAKTAILMARAGCDRARAEIVLRDSRGSLRAALRCYSIET